MKYADAWDDLRKHLEIWIDAFQDVDANKRWAFKSVLNLMNELEETYE